MSQDFFRMYVRGYKAGKTQFGDGSIDFGVRHHGYYASSDPGYHFTATASRDGRTGGFKAVNVPASYGSKGAGVTVQGTWRCASVRKT